MVRIKWVQNLCCCILCLGWAVMLHPPVLIHLEKARMHCFCFKYNELVLFNASTLVKINSRRDSVAWILFSPSRFMWSGISVELSCGNRRIEKLNINTGIWSAWRKCHVPRAWRSSWNVSVPWRMLIMGKRCPKSNQYETSCELCVFTAAEAHTCLLALELCLFS